jgi:CHAD domain-containing protein
MEKDGAVRDHDIALVLYARLGPFDSPSDNGSGGIVRELQERRARSAELLAMSLRQWETDDLISAWRHALSSAAEPAGAQARYWGTPAADTAKAILPAMAKDHFRAGKEAARGKASVDRLHRFRSAARNLRYTLDTFAPLYGKALARLGKQLRAVQDLLGEIHDCSATRRMLADKKETCGKGRRKFLAALKNRQSRKTKEFRKKYGAEFSSADALKRWTSSLRRTGAAKSAPQSSGR